MNRQASNFLAAAAVSWMITSSVFAKELDQFTDRLLVLHYYAGGFRTIQGAPGPERVDAILDARMNELLDALARRLSRDRPQNLADRDAHVRKVFQHRYLPELVTPYEEWIKTDAFIPLYKVRDKGIFGNAVDYDDMRLTWYIELSPIVRAGGVLMGIDKLGHFLAQGFQYYEHYRELSRRGVPEAARYPALRDYGHSQEYGQLGIATGGVYSFADLAANWSGMCFFLALFDDVHIEGRRHSRYFERAATGYRRVRDFHWTEWVSPDWDEVLNPAGLEKRELYDKVAANLRRRPGSKAPERKSICELYQNDPNAFLGSKQSLRPRSTYAAPARAAAVAPYALDIRAICKP